MAIQTLSNFVIRNLSNAQVPRARGSQHAPDLETAACEDQANAHYNPIYLRAVAGDDWDAGTLPLAERCESHPDDRKAEGFCGQCLDEYPLF